MTEQIRGQDVWTDGYMTGDKVMRLSGYKLKNSSPYHLKQNLKNPISTEE